MLKIGILGAGFMGSTHAQAFATLPDVEIVGISSRSQEKAEALAEKYGAKAFTDALALATDPNVDAISNTLPTYLHKDLTIAALEAGKPVLLEKPMGLSVAECDELIAAAERTGKLLMIGQTLRFWPEYMAITDFIKSSALGKPLAASATRNLGPPRWADWFMDPELSGGEVLDLHIHDLDTLNWLFGTPKSIYTRGHLSPESGGWDLAMSLVDYGDVKAYAEGNALQPPEYPFTMTLSVLCEKGTVEFRFRAGGVQVDSRDTGGSGLLVYEQGKDACELAFEAGDGYANAARYFVESVLTGRPLERGTPEQGRMAVATALAARQSLETDQIVVF